MSSNSVFFLLKFYLKGILPWYSHVLEQIEIILISKTIFRVISQHCKLFKSTNYSKNKEDLKNKANILVRELYESANLLSDNNNQ